jgi:ADP-heptose:LPS heptosyltransferase
MKLLNTVNKLIFFLRGKEKVDENSLGKVLVVSSTGFGDTLLSTPAIKSLRKSFSKNKIIFLVNKKFQPLFINYKYVDDIWKYSGSYFNLFHIIFLCRKEKIDTIFLFHSNGPEDVFISLLSGARNILKWTDNKKHDYKSLFLNSANNKIQHHIEKKIDLVRFFKPKVIDTTMRISEIFHQKKGLGYQSKNKKVIGIQLGAQDVYKVWPVENVIELSKKLIKKNYFLVFFGATKFESKMMHMIERSIDFDNAINLNCKTTIEQIPNRIKGLDLLISNDTGILHLAITLKVKSLGLYSPTSNEEFGAYQDKDLHFSIQKDGSFVNNKPKKQRNQDGMKLIKVNEVMSLVEGIV